MRERMANESPQRSRRNRTIQPVTVEPTEPPTMETWATGIGGYLLPRSLSSLVDYGGALGVGAQGYARRKVKGDTRSQSIRQDTVPASIGVGWHPCHHCGTMVTWEHSITVITLIPRLSLTISTTNKTEQRSCQPCSVLQRLATATVRKIRRPVRTDHVQWCDARLPRVGKIISGLSRCSRALRYRLEALAAGTCAYRAKSKSTVTTTPNSLINYA